MCQPVSFIGRRNDVYRSPSGNDSHSDMLRELKLKDDSRSPDFVRVELTMDCDARKVESYRYKCDQDWVPEWYSPIEAEAACREKLKGLLKAGIKIGGKLWNCKSLGIPDDRWYTLAEARAIMARGVKVCR